MSEPLHNKVVSREALLRRLGEQEEKHAEAKAKGYVWAVDGPPEITLSTDAALPFADFGEGCALSDACEDAGKAIAKLDLPSTLLAPVVEDGVRVALKVISDLKKRECDIADQLSRHDDWKKHRHAEGVLDEAEKAILAPTPSPHDPSGG